ncbi:MAG TPA: cyclase family protein [Solirubrobacterales bacterium]
MTGTPREYDFRAEGKRLSNWGRWGDEDERGTLNFITPRLVQAAGETIRTGRVFELSIPIGRGGVPWGGVINRVDPLHLMSFVPTVGETTDAMFGSDDYIVMSLQASTQWDGFAHIGYDDYFYNGVHASELTWEGARRNGIDKTLPGMVGRGVLIDFARLHGVDWLEGGYEIGPDEIEAAEKEQGVRVGTGDAFIFRTGWRRKALIEGWDGWLQTEPGLTADCAAWLRDREVAAVASDNHAVEVTPVPGPPPALPLHAVLIRDMGMPLGEIFDLEELAADCGADGRWEFLFSAPPLRVPGAVGSPVSPIAIK